MRNMSFSKTTQQMRDRTKTVTRRFGWKWLKPGDRLRAVVKGMGLKKGEKVERIGTIEVVSVREELVSRLVDEPEYAREELRLEGFPDHTTEAFCALLMDVHEVDISSRFAVYTTVNRIEFKHVEDQA